jgi:serine phosphatase RsbU (regulator of sigma subunit)/catechol 2,3-dioxygenase-like lactoylglutathione lyase family enzyme
MAASLSSNWLDSHSYLGIHAVNIYVKDQQRSREFYVEKLGFDVAFDASLQTGRRWLAVAPPDGTAVLALIAPEPSSREYKLIGRATGIVFVAENVLAKYEEWRRRGVRFLSTPRLRRVEYRRPASAKGDAEPRPIWGGVFTRFRDIDGNTFRLAGFDTVNREIEAQRKRVADRLEAERRAARELEIAKQVQARLFPQRQPSLNSLEYAGICVQARQVGGDYHDYLDLGRGRFGLVIADIAGKGMAAALLMANLQANLRSQSATASERPELFLRHVNHLFYENTDESAYATLFFGEYDDETQMLRYANCGHLAGLVIRSGGHVDRLESTCTVVGLFKDWICQLEQLRLMPGDLLALYTDGITESFNDADEEYGEARLVDALRRSADQSPDAVIAFIVEEIRQFSREQQDDITLIVARCRVSANSRSCDAHIEK